ncbi:MAG: hypothetical protein ABJ056_04100 [Halioglobus sp.]
MKEERMDGGSTLLEYNPCLFMPTLATHRGGGWHLGSAEWNAHILAPALPKTASEVATCNRMGASSDERYQETT